MPPHFAASLPKVGPTTCSWTILAGAGNLPAVCWMIPPENDRKYWNFNFIIITRGASTQYYQNNSKTDLYWRLSNQPTNGNRLVHLHGYFRLIGSKLKSERASITDSWPQLLLFAAKCFKAIFHKKGDRLFSCISGIPICPELNLAGKALRTTRLQITSYQCSPSLMKPINLSIINPRYVDQCDWM